LVCSLVFALLWLVWSTAELKSIYKAFETTKAIMLQPRFEESTHMLYESPNGSVIVVTPIQGEDALTYAKRSRLLVNVLLQGGDPGINQKCDHWTTPEGGRITLCVTREPGEARQAWCDRFDAVVAAFRKTFPCD
jgi:hypothetical protein